MGLFDVKTIKAIEDSEGFPGDFESDSLWTDLDSLPLDINLDNKYWE